MLYDEIGSGNQRTVYKGRRKGTIEYVAIHCIEKNKRQQIQNNVRICHELEHKHVVQFYEWYETSNHLWLVVELCTGGSLKNILKEDSYLPEDTVKQFGKDVVAGLAYLHLLDIIYSDLRPSKLLLDGDGTLKYSNFSLARVQGQADILDQFTDSLTGENQTPGSPFYMAPEVLKGEVYSKESDLWSLGIVLYEMFTGDTPFKATPFEKMCEEIFEAKITYPMQGQNGTYKKASENLYMLIQGLLQKESGQRIDWLELCLHPFWDGELSYLADSFENMRTSRSVLSDTSVVSQDETLEERSPPGENNRPETVPKVNLTNNLQTRSLHVPDEKTSVISSVKSERDESKQAWQGGTYKIERGLAVMDLTEATSTATEDSNDISYSKARETPQRLQRNTEVELNQSTGSTADVLQRVDGMNLSVIDLLYHTSDLIVTPIAENTKLRKIPPLKWEASSLGFLSLNIDKIGDYSREEIKKQLSLLFATYSQPAKNSAQSKSGLRQKMNILAYLNTLSKVEDVSNAIIEENHIQHLLTDLKMSGQFDLKIRAGRVLGVIASCVTYISPSFNMAEVFSVIADQIKQNFRNSHLKQSLLPAIGEFLFYAATQEESEDRVLQNWEPSGAVFTIINKCLQQTDDYVTRHIAAKTIENIVSTTGRYCKKFLTNEVGLGVWNLFIHAASDIEKVTASSCLCRISMHSSTVVQHVSDRAGLNKFQDGLFSGTSKSQQAFVTIFVALLSSSIHAKRITQDHNLIQQLIHNLESASPVLRGKIYLLLAEMCVRSHDVLLLCCESRLIMFIERDSKKVAGKEHSDLLVYVHKCLAMIVRTIVDIQPQIIEGVLHILSMISGRRHPNVAQTKQLKLHLPLLSAVLHMVTSSVFRKRVVDRKFIYSLGSLLKQIKQMDDGEINLSGSNTKQHAEQATSNVFSIIESITQHPPILLTNMAHVVTDILPVLASFDSSEDGNLRMLSLKLFTDISSLCLENEEEEERTSFIMDLHKILMEHFIPELKNLLQDQHPIPSYCLKLLHAFTERFPSLFRDLIENDIIQNLLSVLRSYQGDINSSVLQCAVGILNNLVSKNEVDFMRAYKNGIIDYVSAAFVEVASCIEDDANVSNVSSLLLQLLDTLQHVLRNIELAVKNVLSNKPADNMASKTEVENLLQESKVLSELNGILLNLLVYDDTDVQKWACRCLYLSAELFGGDVECFSGDNLQCVCQYLKQSIGKQQKVMLRILKRLVTCNDDIKTIFSGSKELTQMLSQLANVNSDEADEKSVKIISRELLELIKL